LPLAFSAEKQSLNSKRMTECFDIQRSDVTHELAIAKYAKLIHQLALLNKEYEAANVSYTRASSWLTNPGYLRFSLEEVERREALREQIYQQQLACTRAIEKAAKDFYPYKGHEEDLHGQQGLKVEFDKSHMDRKREAHQPCKPYSQETFTETVDTYLKANASGRVQNQGRETAIYKMAARLSNYFRSKPDGFAKDAGKSYDVNAFKRKHGLAGMRVTEEDVAPSVRPGMTQ